MQADGFRNSAHHKTRYKRKTIAGKNWRMYFGSRRHSLIASGELKKKKKKRAIVECTREELEDSICGRGFYHMI